jgi:hypothetical protein
MATIKGGDKLAAALAKISRGMSQPALLRVGFLSNAKYPDGKSVAMIAAINEWGAPSRGQPPRPFFRNMVKSKSKEWPKAIADLLKANDYDAVKTLGITGEAIGGQLRQSIIDTNEPPLAPSTIKKKGFSKPLIDTSVMINSINHEVKT